MPTLQRLRPGTRFRLAEMPEITGVLVKANECRAVVRLDRPERDVEFTDQEGQTRQFKSRGSQVTSWAPTTLVEPVGFEPLDDEDNDMSKSKKTTSPKQSKAKSTKAGRDSAAAVLGATINAPLAKPAKRKAPKPTTGGAQAADVAAIEKTLVNDQQFPDCMPRFGSNAVYGKVYGLPSDNWQNG